MVFTLDAQLRCMACAYICGLMLGAVYDFSRLLRALWCKGKAAVFICDLLYMFVFIFFTSFFSIAYSFGRIRYFTVLSEVLGIITVRLTIGRISVKLFSFLIFKIGLFFKKILIKPKKTLKRVLQGIWDLLYNKVKKRSHTSAVD